MGAKLTKSETCITVRVDCKLGYDIWQTLRDGRNAALAARDGAPIIPRDPPITSTLPKSPLCASSFLTGSCGVS